jgi:dihydroorotase-like cyclic amidohydrolase
MKRNWNACSLLVGVQNSPASMKTWMEGLQKIKHIIPMWSTNIYIWVFRKNKKKLKAGFWRDICIFDFDVALLQ